MGLDRAAEPSEYNKSHMHQGSAVTRVPLKEPYEKFDPREEGSQPFDLR